MIKRPSRQWYLTLALGLCSSLNAATPTPIPRSMASMGDSITAGALAGFKRSDGHNPFLMFKLLYYIGKIGYRGSLMAFESRGRSWAIGGGSKVKSHANHFRRISGGQPLQTYNAAVSGATSYNIKEQVDAVLSWSRKQLGQGAPDYVTLAIGANDACNNTNAGMTPTSTYANNVKNAVFRILEANPKARVMISGIPNLEHLRYTAQDSWLALPPMQTCKQMWKLHKFCNNVLVEKDPAKIREVTERIYSYMDEIEFMRRAANERFGADRVRFAFEVHNEKFSDDDISIDCFHPNWKGQQIISDTTWKKSWWSGL